MTAKWGVISQELMKRGILVTTGVKQKLLTIEHPIQVLEQGPKIGFQRGMLTTELLDQMILESKPNNEQKNISQPIGRTIAPIKDPEPVKIQYRNNLPDWREKDFSGIATAVSYTHLRAHET